jgi:hypothetical protein
MTGRRRTLGYKRETTAEGVQARGQGGDAVGLDRVGFGTPVGAKPDFPATNLTYKYIRL